MCETVSAAEKRAERESLVPIEGSASRGSDGTGGEVSRHLVKDFTCTKCGKTVAVAVAYNLRVRGYCGRAGGMVDVDVSRGYKLTRG